MPRRVFKRLKYGGKIRFTFLGVKIDIAKKPWGSYRRLIVGSRPIFGVNDVERDYEGRIKRGKHIHIYGLKNEYIIYLDMRWPFFVKKASKALRRRDAKRRI